MFKSSNDPDRLPLLSLLELSENVCLALSRSRLDTPQASVCRLGGRVIWSALLVVVCGEPELSLRSCKLWNLLSGCTGVLESYELFSVLVGLSTRFDVDECNSNFLYLGGGLGYAV